MPVYSPSCRAIRWRSPAPFAAAVSASDRSDLADPSQHATAVAGQRYDVADEAARAALLDADGGAAWPAIAASSRHRRGRYRTDDRTDVSFLSSVSLRTYASPNGVPLVNP